MTAINVYKRVLALLLVAPLCACATESETVSAQADPMGLLTQLRSIDWDRAREDASQSGAGADRRVADTTLTVPLLLPPTRISTSRAPGQLSFAAPKLLTDAKGYSAVVSSSGFDLLIDASNQMIVTSDVTSSDYHQDFDGEYQSMVMGGQLTIGRYGALYAIQFICTNGAKIECMDEQTAREVVQSLQVQLP